jgi:hypothetical protein
VKEFHALMLFVVLQCTSFCLQPIDKAVFFLLLFGITDYTAGYQTAISLHSRVFNPMKYISLHLQVKEFHELILFVVL